MAPPAPIQEKGSKATRFLRLQREHVGRKTAIYLRKNASGEKTSFLSACISQRRFCLRLLKMTGADFSPFNTKPPCEAQGKTQGGDRWSSVSISLITGMYCISGLCALLISPTAHLEQSYTGCRYYLRCLPEIRKVDKLSPAKNEAPSPPLFANHRLSPGLGAQPQPGKHCGQQRSPRRQSAGPFPTAVRPLSRSPQNGRPLPGALRPAPSRGRTQSSPRPAPFAKPPERTRISRLALPAAPSLAPSLTAHGEPFSLTGSAAPTRRPGWGLAVFSAASYNAATLPPRSLAGPGPRSGCTAGAELWRRRRAAAVRAQTPPGSPRLARPGAVGLRRSGRAPWCGSAAPRQRGACGLGSPSPGWAGEAVRALPAHKHLKTLRSSLHHRRAGPKALPQGPKVTAIGLRLRIPSSSSLSSQLGCVVLLPLLSLWEKHRRASQCFSPALCAPLGWTQTGHEDAQPCRCDPHSFAFSDQICGVLSQEASSE